MGAPAGGDARTRRRDRGRAPGPRRGARRPGGRRRRRHRGAPGRLVHRDLRRVGGALHRRARRDAGAASARRRRRLLEPRPGGRHVAVPAAQGNGGDARGPGPGEHRLQRSCRGVLRDVVDDAARQPRALAGTWHRRRSRRQRHGAGTRSVRHHPAHRRRADDGRRVRLAQPAQHRPVRLAGAVVPARPGDRGGGRPAARWTLAGRPPRRRPGDGRADGRRDVDRPPRRGGERARPAAPPTAARRARRAPRRPVGAAPGRPVVRPRRPRGGRVDPGHAGDRADERAPRPPLRRRPERLVAPDRPGGAPRPGARPHRRVADPRRQPGRGVVALRLQRRRRRRPVPAT